MDFWAPMWAGIHPDFTRNVDATAGLCLVAGKGATNLSLGSVLLHRYGANLPVSRQTFQNFLDTILQQSDHSIPHRHAENFGCPRSGLDQILNFFGPNQELV
jgi:hypothetical protein